MKPPIKPPNIFAGGGFDRAGLRRGDREWIETLFRQQATRLIPVWRDRHLVLSATRPEPGLIRASGLDSLGIPEPGPVLLGLVEDRATFAVDISHIENPAEHPALPEGGSFVDIRDVAALLHPADAQMMAYSRALIHWHRRHGFCGACGAPTEVRDAGHIRVCTNPACGITHFPRTDCAVIMLVTDGDRCLLGRRPGRDVSMYSTLAGFVEPGEALEEAVAREVMEETGIRVGRVDYAHSQPWPFPSQLMVGFYAEAASTEIRCNPDELADARWFDRAEVRTLMAARDREEAMKQGLGAHLPRPVSIARRLIREWVEGLA